MFFYEVGLVSMTKMKNETIITSRGLNQISLLL